MGVASDEKGWSGWNQGKIRRLTEARADLLVPVFFHYQGLQEFIFCAKVE